MRFLRPALAMLVAVLAGMVAAPVSAFPVTPALSWPRPVPTTPVPPDPNCLPVELSYYSVVPQVSGGYWYSMAGTVRACSRYVPVGASWTVAIYRTGGPGMYFGPRSYMSQTGPQVSFTFDGWGAQDSWAACVVKNLRPAPDGSSRKVADPIGCIGPGEVNGLPSAVLVPTTDPRFAGALLEQGLLVRQPVCGSCLEAVTPVTPTPTP
jgi:hypothetical protein